MIYNESIFFLIMIHLLCYYTGPPYRLAIKADRHTRRTSEARHDNNATGGER